MMKIINLDEFRNLPKNTLFRKFEPDLYGDLEVKDETWDYDFVSCSLHGFIEGNTDSGDNSDKHDLAVSTGETFRFDLDFYGRDGLFEESQLFAVYDNEDINQLINKLKTCLK